MADYSFFLAYIVNGLSIASVLFLVASGLSLVLGIVEILNFAHGSFFMVGAYIFLWSNVHIFPNPLANILVTSLLIGGLGALAELLVMRPIYKKNIIEQLLLTFALIFIFEDLVKMGWGNRSQSVPVPQLLAGKIMIEGQHISAYVLFVIALAVVVALGLWLFINRTYWGKIIKAASSDREMANAIGVNVPRLFTGIFFLGSVLAGLGGAVSSPLMGLTPAIGGEIILQAVAVIVIGGLGSLSGTMIGALILGMLESFGVLLFPRYAMFFLYSAMAIVLLVRPRGLLGKVVGEV